MDKINITITLKLNEDLGQPEDMAEAIQLLQKLGITPTNKVSVALVCDSEAMLQKIQERFDDAFFTCPDSVDAEIEVKTKRGARSWAHTKPTPIERAIKEKAPVIKAGLNGDGSARTA